MFCCVQRIETDESADKSAPVDDSSEDEIVQAGQRLKGVCRAGKVKEGEKLLSHISVKMFNVYSLCQICFLWLI